MEPLCSWRGFELPYHLFHVSCHLKPLFNGGARLQIQQTALDRCQLRRGLLWDLGQWPGSRHQQADCRQSGRI